MAIESSLSRVAMVSRPEDDYENATGLEAPEHQEEFDPEGEDPEVEPEDRSPALKRPKGSLYEVLVEQIDDSNIARYLDGEILDQIGATIVEDFQIDENSRKDWWDRAEKAVKFATQVAEQKQFPWPKASNVIYPLIAQSAVEFNARLFPAIIQNRKVVKGIVWGSDDGQPATVDGKPDGRPLPMIPGPDGQPIPNWLVPPGAKRKRADRIGEHMSWQLLHQMPEWQDQTDQLLIQLPIVGGVVRKTWYDGKEGRNRSELVSLANIVWNYHAPSFNAAPRHTEKLLKYPHEIVEAERADEFLPQTYGPGGGGEGETWGWNQSVVSADQGDEDSPHVYLEQHRRLDLDGDGYAEPYIVTVHLRSAKTVRIVANYAEDGVHASEDGETILRIEPDPKYTLYSFLPAMDDGCYPVGFGTLLKPLNAAVNTAVNQMFDAATLQNAGGGFVSDQLGLPSGQTLFQVGRYTRVTTKGVDIRASVFPIPFPGPSTVLFQLLGTLLQAAEKLASTGNILAGDASIANAPPTTVLALIEQGMKIYTAIHKRVFLAEKSELDKLYRLNRRHVQAAEGYTIGDEYREIEPDDYKKGGGVEPIADPTMLTDMQKLGRAQILMEFNGDPLIDQVEIRRRLFDAAGMDRIDDLFSKPNAQQAQFAMAMQQAELGKMRAAEMKDQTQAFLNMALARKNATAGEEAFIQAQLDFLRLSIESLNADTRSQALDHQRRSGMADMIGDHMDRQHEARENALDRAHDMALNALETASAGPGAQPTPGPTGPFPQAPVTTPGPAVTKPAPGGPPGADALGGGLPDAAGPTMEG
jgi:chaperonin GroES